MRAPEVIKDEIIKQLTTVVDPELGIDIVNMGFVYSIDLDEDGICLVELTLEILGCPLEIVLAKMIKEVLVKIPEVKNNLGHSLGGRKSGCQITLNLPWV